MANRHQDIETRMASKNTAEDIFNREFKHKYYDQGGIIYKNEFIILIQMKNKKLI